MLIKNNFKLPFVFTLHVFFMCLFPTLVFSQANDKIYYDTFYEEYYNSFPNKKPKINKSKKIDEEIGFNKLSLSKNKNNKHSKSKSKDQQFKIPSNWDSIYYNEAMRYWEYKTSDFRFDISYQKISSQFEFEMQVGSILKWDRLNGSQLKANFSKDFRIANKQYVGSFEYKTGSVTSDYTLDDDLWNELHIFSAGKGDGKLSDIKASFGMRNYFRFYGWNLTPSVGIQKKRANLKMFGHGQPVPFFLNCANPITPDPAYPEEQVCKIHIGGTDYYIAQGSLIPEGPVTLYDDQNLTPGHEFELPFNHGDYMEYFKGYSTVNAINGVSHYYDAGWFGPFLSLDLEKIISIREGLLFKFEIFRPTYKARGVWPKRTEWKDFYDKGGASLGYSFTALYTMKITPSVGVYGSFTTDYIISKQMDTIINYTDGDTITNKKEIKRAEWKSMILELGLKYLF